MLHQIPQTQEAGPSKLHPALPAVSQNVQRKGLQTDNAADRGQREPSMPMLALHTGTGHSGKKIQAPERNITAPRGHGTCSRIETRDYQNVRCGNMDSTQDRQSKQWPGPLAHLGHICHRN